MDGCAVDQVGGIVSKSLGGEDKFKDLDLVLVPAVSASVSASAVELNGVQVHVKMDEACFAEN